MMSTHVTLVSLAGALLLSLGIGGSAAVLVPDGDLANDPDARGFAELLFAYGRLAWVDADGESALAYFDRATAAWPQDDTYPYFAGAVAMSLRRFDAAVGRLGKALPPAHSRIPAWRVYSDLGAAHYLNGNPRAAEPQLQRALGLQPTDAATHLYLGLVLLDLGKPEESVPHFEAARANARGLTADSHFYIGVAALRKGRSGEARREFEASRKSAHSVRHSIPEIISDLNIYLDLLEDEKSK